MERLRVLPTIGVEVAPVRGENATFSKLSRREDKRGVCQIHGQVRVLFHQRTDGAEMFLPDFMDTHVSRHLFDEAQLRLHAQPREHEVAGFGHDRPRDDERFVESAGWP